MIDVGLSFIPKMPINSQAQWYPPIIPVPEGGERGPTTSGKLVSSVFSERMSQRNKNTHPLKMWKAIQLIIANY